MSRFILEESKRELLQSLREKGISDERVLEAVNKVPRESFVHPAFVARAYEDSSLPIGENQTISQPFTVAFMTQKLSVEAGDKILEIGTGSGYQSAILSSMGARVVSIERHRSLHEQAKALLNLLKANVQCLCADGTLGYRAEAPYNKIIVTAGAPVIPQTLAKQLAIGGIMITPVGNEQSQNMVITTRISESEFTTEENPISFRFVPLLGKEGWK